MTTTYTQASKDVSAAQRAYDAAVARYLAREIGDAEFLAAKKIMDAANRAYDAAFAAEAGWVA